MTLHATQLLSTPATHATTVVHLLDGVWNKLARALSNVTWTPMSQLVKKGALSTLEQTVEGELTVIANGETFVFGRPVKTVNGKNLKATLVVYKESFWMRLAMFGDLGFAEAFMDGDIGCEDISALLQIFIANRRFLGGMSRSASPLLSVGRWLTAYKFLGDISTSRANISAHYDLGNTMFSSFLSEDMNYSSAIFKDFNEDLRLGAVPELETHEEAQLRKMKNILHRLRIQPGDRVLEIGTGWGSLSILAATTHPECTIDTITLSSEQADLATRRISSLGLSDRITVHLIDFRSIRSNPEWKGVFDRFVSIEMIENVGREFIPEYWEVVDWAMKGEGKEAVGVVQVITMAEARIPTYDRDGADFIQKWIFPGCYIPSLQFLISTLTSSTSGRLTVDSVSNIGPHYARTLRAWKSRFLLNWEGTIKVALEERYRMNEEDLEVFKRKWIYYFDYCEAGFAMRSLGDHIITFTREGNINFGCDFDPCSVV